MLTFNTDGMVTQHFPFRASLMDYIFKNVQPQHLIKLYPTCKFFYDKFRKNIIRDLEIVDDGEKEVIDPVKTIIHASNPVLSNLVDFRISDSFTVRAPYYLLQLPKFTYCTIKKLKLAEHVEWKDFEILTRAGTVEELKIMKSIWIPGIGGTCLDASVDQIISQVQNAKSIEIYNGYFSVTTCSSLVSLKHKAKLSNVVLHHIITIHTFNLPLFTEFILNNADPECNVHLSYYLLPTDASFNRTINKHCIALGIRHTKEIKTALEKKNIVDQMA